MTAPPGRELPGIRPGTASNEGLTGTQKFGYLVIAAIIIGVISIWLSTQAGDGGSSTPSSSGRYEAIAQCEARIENLLKSPGTADFSTDASGAGSGWTIAGSVDSENGFGALVRSDFQCTVELQGDSATTTVDYLR